MQKVLDVIFKQTLYPFFLLFMYITIMMIITLGAISLVGGNPKDYDTSFIAATLGMFVFPIILILIDKNYEISIKRKNKKTNRKNKKGTIISEEIASQDDPIYKSGLTITLLGKSKESTKDSKESQTTKQE